MHQPETNSRFPVTRDFIFRNVRDTARLKVPGIPEILSVKFTSRCAIIKCAPASNREQIRRSALLFKMTGSVDFDNLVDLHYAGLYRFALSLTRDESQAADLTQQTFYIWAAKGHQLQDRTKAKSWLFTTLHREFLAGQRRLNRFRHYELTEVSGELPNVDPALVNQLDSQTLLGCLSQIDPLFRAPIALFYLEEYAYKEIAEVLEIPLGTVKSRIARGLVQLHDLVIDAPRGEPKGARV